MKFLIATFVVLVSMSSFADSSELITSCKLSGVSEEVKIEGTANVVRIDEKLLRINVDALLTVEEEEADKHEGSDEISKTATLNGQELKDYLAKDDLGQVLVERLNGETPVELKEYQSKNNEDDAAGYSLTQLKGEKGTVKGILTIGWGVAFCD
ncbi:MAG: hypothetical protein V4596_03040 [Bdellovibrionota bacterium]